MRARLPYRHRRETIRYKIVSGMRFEQHLQAYPGPIVTLGFFGIALGRMLAAKADQMQSEALNKTLVDTLQAEDIEIQDLGDDYTRYRKGQEQQTRARQFVYGRLSSTENRR